MENTLDQIVVLDRIFCNVNPNRKRIYDVKKEVFAEALMSGEFDRDSLKINVVQSDGKKYMHRLNYNGMTLILVTDKKITPKSGDFNLWDYPFYN